MEHKGVDERKMEETKETVNTQEKDTKSAADSSTQTNQIPGYTLEAGVKMKPCKYCRVMVPKKAKICPNCKKKIRKNWLGFLVFLLVIALLAGGGVYYYLYLYEPAQTVSTAVPAAPEEPAAKETTPEESAEDTATAETTAAETTVAESAAGDTAAAETTSQTTTTDTQKDSTVTANATEAEAAEALIQPLTEENTAAAEQSDAATSDGENSEDTLENPLDVTGAEEAAQEEETAPEVIDPAAYSEDDFRALCISVDFRKLMRTPDAYLNQCLMLEGTIVAQVDGGLFDENLYYLISVEDKNGVERYYILRDDRGEDAIPLFEGDGITIYGQMFATGKLPVEYGIRNNKVPAVSIVYCDLKEE